MKVLFTSALIPHRYDERKEEYIDSFVSLSQMVGKDNILIGEFYSETPDFLSELTPNLYLTKTHTESIRNKGVLWVNGMIKLIEDSGVENEDFLVHLTGRYKFENDTLFQAMNQNPDYEVYYKPWDEGRQSFTGAFGCRGNIMVEFLRTVNLNRMETGMINIERIFKDFADTKRCFLIEDIGVSARIFGNGSGQLITHKI